MSFWSTSTGEQATGKVQDNDFAPLPKAWYPVLIEEFTVKESLQYDNQIKIKARVVGPDYKNRVLFLNLKVWSKTQKQRDRALNVLVATANAFGIPLPKGEPDDAWLSKMTNKPCEMLVDVFEIEEEGKEPITGNWLVNVRGRASSTIPKQATKAKEQPIMSSIDLANDSDPDIPF